MSDDYVYSEAEIVRDVTREATAPTEIDPTKLYLTADSRSQIIDLEDRLPSPRRAKGVYVAATVESFIGYAKHHESPEKTTVWIEPTAGRIIAVLDDHGDEGPNWGQHRIKLLLTPSDEWVRWKSRDGRLGSQQEFAEHIEESQLDIVEPDGATVLEMAESFHATTSAQFKSAQRLATGEVQFAYVEEVNATAGKKGEIDIPKSITVALAPFLGEEVVPIEALIRYRVRAGELAIGYKLVRPDDVVRAAIDMIAGRLRGEFERVYLGEPRS
jgi:uncharacterized protein YfdQ (DUF2303 family)